MPCRTPQCHRRASGRPSRVTEVEGSQPTTHVELIHAGCHTKTAGRMLREAVRLHAQRNSGAMPRHAAAAFGPPPRASGRSARAGRHGGRNVQTVDTSQAFLTAMNANRGRVAAQNPAASLLLLLRSGGDAGGVAAAAAHVAACVRASRLLHDTFLT